MTAWVEVIASIALRAHVTMDTIATNQRAKLLSAARPTEGSKVFKVAPLVLADNVWILGRYDVVPPAVVIGETGFHELAQESYRARFVPEDEPVIRSGVTE